MRALAPCAIVANPWGGSPVAVEEPENGVHPGRLEVVVQPLASLVTHANRQVIVTTHSPRFCELALRTAPDDAGAFHVQRVGSATEVTSGEAKANR